MKILHNIICRSQKIFLIFILLTNSAITVSSQIQTQIYKDTKISGAKQKALIDTTPKGKIKTSDGIKVNDDLMHYKNMTGTADTVWDLTPYLNAKSSCDYEKTMDEDGCIIVTYTDGFKKTVCGGAVIDVTLANGKKYVRRMGQGIRHEVMRIPAPNPTGTETAYNWLVGYNQALLNDIEKYLITKAAFNKYLDTERAVCKGMFYKQIDYRTIFIQEFLKAK